MIVRQPTMDDLPVLVEAVEADVGLLIVWPSDESGPFYARQGFVDASEAMIWANRS